MAALGGHWSSALFSGGGAVLCLSDPSFLLLLLFANRNICLIWIHGKQQVPPVVAEGQIPRCPGSRPCTAEVEDYYKHMKDRIMYFLQANKTQRIFFF